METVKIVGFFDWNDNYCEAFVRIVEKSQINSLFDINIASVEMNNGEILEVYNVDGELCGYYEAI